jgi:hypothetical protein
MSSMTVKEAQKQHSENREKSSLNITYDKEIDKFVLLLKI